MQLYNLYNMLKNIRNTLDQSGSVSKHTGSFDTISQMTKTSKSVISEVYNKLDATEWVTEINKLNPENINIKKNCHADIIDTNINLGVTPDMIKIYNNTSSNSDILYSKIIKTLPYFIVTLDGILNYDYNFSDTSYTIKYVKYDYKLNEITKGENNCKSHLEFINKLSLNLNLITGPNVVYTEVDKNSEDIATLHYFDSFNNSISIDSETGIISLSDIRDPKATPFSKNVKTIDGGTLMEKYKYIPDNLNKSLNYNNITDVKKVGDILYVVESTSNSSRVNKVRYQNNSLSELDGFNINGNRLKVLPTLVIASVYDNVLSMYTNFGEKINTIEFTSDILDYDILENNTIIVSTKNGDIHFVKYDNNSIDISSTVNVSKTVYNITHTKIHPYYIYSSGNTIEVYNYIGEKKYYHTFSSNISNIIYAYNEGIIEYFLITTNDTLNILRISDTFDMDTSSLSNISKDIIINDTDIKKMSDYTYLIGVYIIDISSCSVSTLSDATNYKNIVYYNNGVIINYDSKSLNLRNNSRVYSMINSNYTGDKGECIKVIGGDLQSGNYILFLYLNRDTGVLTIEDANRKTAQFDVPKDIVEVNSMSVVPIGYYANVVIKLYNKPYSSTRTPVKAIMLETRTFTFRATLMPSEDLSAPGGIGFYKANGNVLTYGAKKRYYNSEHYNLLLHKIFSFKAYTDPDDTSLSYTNAAHRDIGTPNYGPDSLSDTEKPYYFCTGGVYLNGGNSKGDYREYAIGYDIDDTSWRVNINYSTNEKDKNGRSIYSNWYLTFNKSFLPIQPYPYEPYQISEPNLGWRLLIIKDNTIRILSQNAVAAKELSTQELKRQEQLPSTKPTDGISSIENLRYDSYELGRIELPFDIHHTNGLITDFHYLHGSHKDDILGDPIYTIIVIDNIYRIKVDLNNYKLIGYNIIPRTNVIGGARLSIDNGVTKRLVECDSDVEYIWDRVNRIHHINNNIIITKPDNTVNVYDINNLNQKVEDINLYHHITDPIDTIVYTNTHIVVTTANALYVYLIKYDDNGKIIGSEYIKNIFEKPSNMYTVNNSTDIILKYSDKVSKLDINNTDVTINQILTPGTNGNITNVFNNFIYKIEGAIVTLYETTNYTNIAKISMGSNIIDITLLENKYIAAIVETGHILVINIYNQSEKYSIVNDTDAQYITCVDDNLMLYGGDNVYTILNPFSRTPQFMNILRYKSNYNTNSTISDIVNINNDLMLVKNFNQYMLVKTMTNI